MKTYILLPIILAACGGTIDPQPSDATPQDDSSADAVLDSKNDGGTADASPDACLAAKQPCNPTRCQFSNDPADSLGCGEAQGYTWRPDDASTGITCTMQQCDPGTVCWDNADPTHMGHCVAVLP